MQAVSAPCGSRYDVTGPAVWSNLMPDSWTTSGVDLHLDVPPGRGRRVALENALRLAIRDGRLPSGERLPSSRALAAQLRLARGTVVEAYSQLVAEGYLRARPGAVTEVAHAPDLQPARGVDPVRPRIAADFRWGFPDLSSFPRTDWLRALRRSLQTTPHSELGLLDPRGSLRLRTALASYLGRVRGVLCTPERIVICNGFAQGLRLICDALAAEGAQTIGMEDPCMADHRAIAAAAGLGVAPLEVDREGASVEPVCASVPRVVVLTPAHQTPLGATLSTTRRAEFVRFATESGNYIVEDDYDGEFRYDRHPVGALQGLAPQRVIYAGSASKSLAPGVRLAWLVVPDELMDTVIEAKRRADRGTDAFAQLALAELIESGTLDRHIRRMRLRYRHRRDALVTTLAACAPTMPLHGIAAGLHVVLGLPPGVLEADVRAAAKPRSIALTALGPFWHDGGPRAQGIVVGYGTPYEHEFPSALTRLGKLLRTIG